MNVFKCFFLTLIFLANAFAGNAQVRDIGKPNIIFILTDDYASNLVDFMPNLKAMQKAGVTFSNYYVSNSLCCRIYILDHQFYEIKEEKITTCMLRI